MPLATTSSVSIRSGLLQLTLIPMLLAVFVIAVLLTGISWTEVNKHIANKGNDTSQQIAQLIAPFMARNPSRETVERYLSFGMAAALDETSVRSVSVYNVEGIEVLHTGPQFLHRQLESLQPGQVYDPVESHGSTLFTRAISLTRGDDMYGWVRVEVSHDRYMAQRYRMALIIILTCLAALMVSLGMILFNSGRIYKPLVAIKMALQNMAYGNLEPSLKLPKSWAFQDLASRVNDTASALQESRRELQENAEQATTDLRESLDTVEMQNVELSLARKEAIEASRAKSEFLANTSHEIRTPINGILGFTGLLLKTRVNAQQKDYLHTIQKSSQGLLSIINDILDVAKLETGQLVLDYTPFNVRDELEATLQMLAPLASEKQLQLIAIVEQEVPLYLQGDAQRLKQVLANLVNNAIQFSGKGNIVVRVKCMAAEESGTQLKFEVVDQGVGISKDQQRNLFNAFTQADASNSRRQGGAGLGLAVARGLVEKMQGQIAVTSEPGEGATFWFTAQFGLNRDTAHYSSYSKLAGKRLLICDDNSMVVEQLRSYCERWEVEYLVVNQETGIIPALENQFEQGPVNCVLWDVSSARDIRDWVKNNEVLKTLKDRYHCNLVLLSPASPELDYREEEEELCVSIVQKPLSHDELYQVLCKVAIDVDTESGSEADGHKSPANILAVDDNPANLQLIGELLRDLGATVTLAENGEEALQRYSEQTFDLIFMDIQMPGIDGLETTRRIRQQEADAQQPDTKQRTPVVALTAHAMTDQKAQLLLAGLDDYLNKPVTEAQLKHVIQRWTQKTVRPQTQSSSAESPTAVDGSHHHNIPVDLSLSLQLSNHKPVLARDMLTMLLQSLPDNREKITTALKKEDYETLGTVVHKLHGGASYCGVPRLKAACAKVEDLIQKKKLDALHHPIAALLDAITQLINWEQEHDLDILFEIDESMTG